MKKNIVIFEVEGGTDKWIDGHRKDTMPIIAAIKARGWDAEVIFFRDEWEDIIFDFAKDRFDAYVSRVNPGNLIHGEKAYFNLLRRLSAAGLLGMSHPDVMMNFGSKDALVKLIDTALVPQDTYAYYDFTSFKTQFPISLSHGVRVLKQNRGSTGEGIWRVEVIDDGESPTDQAVALDAMVKCTEAVGNLVQYHRLADFIDFCEQYIIGLNGMLIDMRFLPRIKEGEIRILLIGATPIFVVHKKPAASKNAFSATLFSGAQYRYDQPQDWAKLINWFLPLIPSITQRLAVADTPLIWSADFMLDWDEQQQDKYILGEINCSCVGFTSHLEQGIQDIVAAEIIARVEKQQAIAA